MIRGGQFFYFSTPKIKEPKQKASPPLAGAQMLKHPGGFFFSNQAQKKEPKNAPPVRLFYKLSKYNYHTRKRRSPANIFTCYISKF